MLRATILRSSGYFYRSLFLRWNSLFFFGTSGTQGDLTRTRRKSSTDNFALSAAWKGSLIARWIRLKRKDNRKGNSSNGVIEIFHYVEWIRGLVSWNGTDNFAKWTTWGRNRERERRERERESEKEREHVEACEIVDNETAAPAASALLRPERIITSVPAGVFREMGTERHERTKVCAACALHHPVVE